MKFVIFNTLLVLNTLVGGSVVLAQETPTSLGVVRHNHLALHVKDLPASAAFTATLSGLNLLPYPTA